MLEFLPFTIEDKEIVQRYTSQNNYRICEYCFTDLFIWKDHYDTQRCFHDGFMFIKMQTFEEKQTMYLAPIGQGDLKQALLLLEEDAQERGIPFILCGTPEPLVEKIEEVLPDRYTFTDVESSSDYIYLSEKMCSLSGKKLQAKRNFINRFKKTYEGRWSYEEMTAENAPEAYQFHLHWSGCDDENACPAGLMYTGETCAVSLALNHREEIGMKGGILRLDGKMIGFSMGSPVSDDTYVIQLEKAESSVPGAYPMINQQFALHNCTEYKYINREDDLGIEGLRKAKHSYHPEMMGKKFMAVKKHDPIC